MGSLMLILSGFVVVFVGLVVVMGRFAVGRMERSVSGRFEEADFIINTGLAPGSWTARYHRNLKRMERCGTSDPRRTRYEEVARRRLVRRLRRLERYFNRTSLFGDEATRRHITSRIKTVKNSWKKGLFSDFAPRGIGPGPV